MLDQLIDFQRSVFDENPIISYTNIPEKEFLAMTLIHASKIRPFSLLKIVDQCIVLCESIDFKSYLLFRGILDQPVLIHRLFKRGIFSDYEIFQALRSKYRHLSFLYFKEDIKMIDQYDFSPILRTRHRKLVSLNLNEAIEYGFEKDSIEYSIKYDDASHLLVLMNDPLFNLNTRFKWCPFEWSYAPNSMKLIDVSAYYGSINCFKQLLLLGSQISIQTINCVYSSGVFDLIHQLPDHPKGQFLHIAYRFCHYGLIDWVKESCSGITHSKLFSNPSIYGKLFICGFNHFEKLEKQGQNLIFYVCKAGSLSLLEYFVEKGANLFAKSQKTIKIVFHGLFCMLLLKMALLILLTTLSATILMLM